MRRSLLWFGLALSAAYCLTMWWMVGERLGSLKIMELNSLGDFLAGVFSPLAFLWLVLGFIQQGFELRISSDALRLQAKELRDSVAQQAELALATKMSLKNQEVSFEPVFHLKFSGLGEEFDESGRVEICSFELRNAGSSCEQVKVRLMHDDTALATICNYPLVERNGVASFRVIDVLDDFEPVQLSVYYRKFNGSDGVQSFELIPTSYPDDPSDWFVKIRKVNRDAV